MWPHFQYKSSQKFVLLNYKIIIYSTEYVKKEETNKTEFQEKNKQKICVPKLNASEKIFLQNQIINGKQ